MDQLLEMMGDGKLAADLDDGFTPKDFIEVKEQKTEPTAEENAIVWRSADS